MGEEGPLIDWSAHLPPGTERGSVDLTARVSLPAAWAAAWRADPERSILRDPTGTWVTARELLERSAAVAGRFFRAGARPGDRVLIAAPTSSPLVVAHCAALRAGLVVVPVNPAATPHELEAVLGVARPRLAVLGSEQLREAAANHTGLVVSTPEVTLDDGPPPPSTEALPEDPGMLMYTSGTTGAPKGAVLSHANLLAGAESVRLAWRWGRDDRLILCLPLSHVHGLGIGLHGSLLSGAVALLFDRFDAESVLREADRGQATMFFGVPTMYERLVAAERPERLGRLRLCVSGSAALSADLHHRIGEACGQVVLERYGMTETLLTVSNPVAGERRAGTVGFPLPGIDLRLDESSGEILVRGPSVFAGYRDLPEVNADAFLDGWFRTGDIGRVENGYLSIVGRAKELIISGGYNVYPREVEDVLRMFPGVRDCAVVGVPSVEWGESVAAFVEAAEDVDLAALADHASAQLAFYKRPRSIERVDELPRNLLGKVVKERLAVGQPR